MAVVTLVHGFQFVPLGSKGWKWIGIAIGAGGGGLWCLTEKIWGRYLHHGEAGG